MWTCIHHPSFPELREKRYGSANASQRIQKQAVFNHSITRCVYPASPELATAKAKGPTTLLHCRIKWKHIRIDKNSPQSTCAEYGRGQNHVPIHLNAPAAQELRCWISKKITRTKNSSHPHDERLSIARIFFFAKMHSPGHNKWGAAGQELSIRSSSIHTTCTTMLNIRSWKSCLTMDFSCCKKCLDNMHGPRHGLSYHLTSALGRDAGKQPTPAPALHLSPVQRLLAPSAQREEDVLSYQMRAANQAITTTVLRCLMNA